MLRRDDDSVWLSSTAASLPKSLIAVEPHERGVLLPRRGPPSPRTALSPQSSARSLRPSHRCVAGPEPSSWFLGSQRGSGIFFGKPPEGRGRGARWPGIPSCDASSAGGGKSDGAEDASDRPTDPRPREERGSCADVFRACRPPLPRSDVLFCNSLPLMLILFYLA